MSLFLKAVFVFVGFMLLAHATPVFAQGGGGGPAGIPQIEYMFARVVCVAVPLGYTALLVVLVIAGLKYLTSAGEPKAVQAAHQTVTWGLLGILFLAIAWLILLLIQNFTGVEVTKFSVSSLPGVQGFTGSCSAPTPVATEPSIAPPEATSLSSGITTPPPSTTNQCVPIPEAPDVRICNGLVRRDNNRTNPFPQCEHYTTRDSITIRICRAELDCKNQPTFVRRVSSLEDWYRPIGLVYTGDIEEALLPLIDPHWISYYNLEEGIDSGAVYIMDSRSGPTSLDLYGVRYGWVKYRKNHLDSVLIQQAAKATQAGAYLEILNKKRDKGLISEEQYYGSRREQFVTREELLNVMDRYPLLVIGCREADFYPTDIFTPLIYFYPQKQTPVSLKISAPIFSPYFNSNQFWSIIVKPSGYITTLGGQTLKFIPYEFLRSDFKRPEKGFVVEGGKLEDYLKNEFWPKLGLTESEINDYWVDTKPRVKPSPYYFVSLIDRSEIDRVLPMEVNPKPDTVLRNMTYILPLPSKSVTTPVPLEEEKLKAPERKGFTVLENGVFTDGF